MTPKGDGLLSQRCPQCFTVCGYGLPGSSALCKDCKVWAPARPEEKEE